MCGTMARAAGIFGGEGPEEIPSQYEWLGGCNRPSRELLSMPWLCIAFHNVSARCCSAVTDVIKGVLRLRVCHNSAVLPRESRRHRGGC